MKKIILLISIIVLAFAGCTEDKDKWSDVQKDMDVGGAIPYLKFFTPKLFDITDLGNAQMRFLLDVGASLLGSLVELSKLIESRHFEGDGIEWDRPGLLAEISHVPVSSNGKVSSDPVVTAPGA